MAIVVDVSTGAAVAADNDDAISAVVPPSSTNDEDAYVGASVAFEGVCDGAFADGAKESATGLRAAATALPPLRCAPPSRFALPPPPLTLPPPPRRRQAAAKVALSRCRHRR